MPFGLEIDDLFIERHTNPAAHANTHGFTVHGGDTVLEMMHQVVGHQAQPLIGSNYRLDGAPFALELFLLVLRFVIGQLDAS